MKYKKSRRKTVKKSTPNKKVKNATKCEYDGKEFKSRLELSCYMELKKAGIPFTYEETRYILQKDFINPNKFVKRKSKANKDLVLKENEKIRAITYLPDFQGENWIIETKGVLTESNTLRIKMLQHHLYENFKNMHFFLLRNKEEILKAIEIIKKL